MLVEVAPPGSRLAVATEEWAWPLAVHIGRCANPEVQLHWIGASP